MIFHHRKFILRPPDLSKEYNLSKPLEEVLQDRSESVFDLAMEMDAEFFKGQLRNGFFIEAGASNGNYINIGPDLRWKIPYFFFSILTAPLTTKTEASSN